IIAEYARNVIQCTPSNSLSHISSPPVTPSDSTAASPSGVAPLNCFIANLVERSRVQAGTLICTLVYLNRLKQRLPKDARGMECTCHRIFLAALIITGKYLNDTSPKNKYWARYSNAFSVPEVNLMETQLLLLLDFELRISIEDLEWAAAVFYPIVASKLPLTPTTPNLLSHTAESTNCSLSAKQTPLDSVRPYPPSLSVRSHQHQYVKLTKTVDCPAPASSSPIPNFSKDNTIDYGVGNPGADHHLPQTAAETALQQQRQQYATTQLQTTDTAAAKPYTGDTSSKLTVNTGAVAAASANDTSGSRSVGQPQPVAKPDWAAAYSQCFTGSSSSLVRPRVSKPRTSHATMGLATASHAMSTDAFPIISTASRSAGGEDVPIRPSPKKRAITKMHTEDVPYPSPIYTSFSSSTTANSLSPTTATTSLALSRAVSRDVSQATLSYENSILTSRIQNLDLFKSATPDRSTTSLAGTLVSGSTPSPSSMPSPIPAKRATNPKLFARFNADVLVSHVVCSSTIPNNGNNGGNDNAGSVGLTAVPVIGPVPAEAKQRGLNSKLKKDKQAKSAHLHYQHSRADSNEESLREESRRCLTISPGSDESAVQQQQQHYHQGSLRPNKRPSASGLKSKLFTPISAWFKSSRAHHPYTSLQEQQQQPQQGANSSLVADLGNEGGNKLSMSVTTAAAPTRSF
ncbi:PHO85 cyclin-1, partial [Spiromyces aspiralis]